MGVVYRAQDPSGRQVAVKLLQARRESMSRFAREARLQDQLGETEGFVPLLDMGVSPHGPYLVMPLLDSGTLRDRIERDPNMPIEQAVELVRELAAGLGKAHARGIVHRDVKPDNVLFSARGRPLLADLGLAKHFRTDVEGGSQSIALSRPGQARGTFGYMAPEQLQDAAQSGPPADVYALGAVLYEVVTGQPAFRASTFVELMSKVVEGKVKHPRSLRKDCPSWLCAVIARALAVDPSKRYPDGAAFAAALQEPANARQPKLLAGIVAVVLVLALGLAAWVGTRPTTTSEGSGGGVEHTDAPAWASLPLAYQELGKAADGPRLVAVWGHERDVGPVLAVAPREGGAVSLESRGLRQWGDGSPPEGLLLATPEPEQRFQAGALLPGVDRALTSSGTFVGWNLADSSKVVEVTLESPAQALAISPNGFRGAVCLGSTIYRVRVGTTANPEQLGIQHATDVRAVAVSSTHEILTGGGTQAILHTLRGSYPLHHELEVVGVAFLGPAARPLTLDLDGGLRTWDGDALQSLADPPADGLELGPAVALAVDGPGTRIAVAHLNGVRLLRGEGLQWREQHRVLLPPGGARITTVALAADGGRLLLGTSRGAVLSFAVPDPDPPAPGRTLWSPVASGGDPRGRLADSPEALCALPGDRLLTASADGWVQVWSAKDGSPLRAFQVGTPLYGAAVREGRYVLTQGGGHCLRVYDLAQDPPLEIQRIGLEGAPLQLGLSPNQRYAVVSDLEGRVTLLDLEQRTRVAQVSGSPRMQAVACFDDGRIALGKDGSVDVLDPVTGVRDPPHLTGGGGVTALLPLGGDEYAAGTDHGAVIRFRLGRKTALGITMMGGYAVRSLSRDEGYVVVGMRKGALMRIELEGGADTWQVQDQVGPQALVCALGSGRFAAVGTFRVPGVFDATNGEPVWSGFAGHRGEVRGLQVLDDGGLLSVGSDGPRRWTPAGASLSPSWHSPMIYCFSAGIGRDGTVLGEEVLSPLRPREELQVGVRLHGPSLPEPRALELGEVDAVGTSPDGSIGYVFATNPDRATTLDLTQGGEFMAAFTLGGTLQAWSVSPDGATAAFAAGTQLSLREARKGELQLRVDGSADALAFLPQPGGGQRLLCGRRTGGIDLRELEKLQIVQSLASELEILAVCAVGPDRFLTLDAARRVLAWDLARGKDPVAELDLGDPTDQATSLASDLAGRVAVGTGKGRVVVFRWGG